jgi:hypothetical protein
MRRLQFINRPSSPGVGVVLPSVQQGGAGYYPVIGNAYIHLDDFLDTNIDAQEWADGSNLGTSGASPKSVANSFLTMTTSTATGTIATFVTKGSVTSGNNIYNVPFRVLYNARISTTAGAGIAPTGGLDFYLGVRDSAEQHIAQFHIDCSTAGGSSLAAPAVSCETRQGSTAAAFINSAATIIFNSAWNRTATMVTGFMIEVTHRGVAFALRDPVGNNPPQLLSYFGSKIPRIDKNYALDMRAIANGTAGYTQSSGVSFEIDNVTVEQFAPEFAPLNPGQDSLTLVGGVRSGFVTQALGSAAGSLVTSGSGLFLGYSAGSSATSGGDLFLAVWDASAAGSSVYDFVSTNSATSLARLLWYGQLGGVSSAGADGSGLAIGGLPAGGLPFQRGLVVGSVTGAASAVGGSALNVLVVYRANS